jgi:hypothetical protein
MNDVVRCPTCGFEYTHMIGGVVTNFCADNDEKFVEIFMTCEDGHDFTIEIRTRKGQTEIARTPDPE